MIGFGAQYCKLVMNDTPLLSFVSLFFSFILVEPVHATV